MTRALLLGALLALTLAGCTMKSRRAASSETVNPDAQTTGQTQQGVGTPENPTPPPTDSGKAKPKASDVSKPTAD